MLQAAESLIPIILLVTLGSFLTSTGFIDARIRNGLDRFVYWIALPSLFIHNLAGSDFRELDAGNLILVLILSTLGACMAAVFFARLMRLAGPHSGVFVQAGFRGNLAFVGLPLIILTLDGSDRSQDLISEALLAMAVLTLLYNIISIAILYAAQNRNGKLFQRRLLYMIIKNPLILSAIAGTMLGWLDWSIPVIIDRPLMLLGQTAVALALVSLGGALIQFEIRGNLNLALSASMFKILFIPVMTWALSLIFGLTAGQTLVAMIFSACPIASASYIMATQMDGDPGLAASSIVTSTILAMIPLTLILILF